MSDDKMTGLNRMTRLGRVAATWLLLVMAMAQVCAAANLTPAQLATLKSDMAANFPGLPDEEAAAAYNVAASPDYWVWRNLVTESEVYESPSVDGTFWSWTIYIARSQAEREAWRQMVSMRGGLKPSLANVRIGVADIFSGAGGAAQRTHLLTVGRRKATRGEKLFAAGTGSTADPATMAVEGLITATNVSEARNLP